MNHEMPSNEKVNSFQKENTSRGKIISHVLATAISTFSPYAAQHPLVSHDEASRVSQLASEENITFLQDHITLNGMRVDFGQKDKEQKLAPLADPGTFIPIPIEKGNLPIETLETTSEDFFWYINGVGMNKLPSPETLTASAPITIAVIDSGFTGNTGNRAIQKHNVLSDTDAVEKYNVADNYGHGTLVANILLKTIERRPNINIMIIKVYEKDGAYSRDVVKGIEYAIENGANILNISMGTPQYLKDMCDAVENALKKGTTVVASAGNAGEDSVDYPAACNTTNPNLIAVGGIKKDGHPDIRINYGSAVDISTFSAGVPTFDGYGNLKFIDGSSAAAPIAAAAAAIIALSHPLSETGNLMVNFADKPDPNDGKRGKPILNVAQAFWKEFNPQIGETTIKQNILPQTGGIIDAKAAISYTKTATMTVEWSGKDGVTQTQYISMSPCQQDQSNNLCATFPVPSNQTEDNRLFFISFEGENKVGSFLKRLQTVLTQKGNREALLFIPTANTQKEKFDRIWLPILFVDKQTRSE